MVIPDIKVKSCEEALEHIKSEHSNFKPVKMKKEKVGKQIILFLRSEKSEEQKIKRAKCSSFLLNVFNTQVESMFCNIW